MSKRNNKISYFVTILVVLVLIGFYFVLNTINSLRKEVKNLELALEISKKENSLVGETDLTQETPTESVSSKISVIPTAIIFETLSSPILEPQTKITVTVESVSKTEDGTVGVHIRAFTSEATAYSALVPQNFFELIDVESGGQSLKPIETIGAFSSIPPKSVVAGRVNFKIEPAKNSIILQVSFDETTKYYELDFSKKSYKETVLG